MQPARGLFKNLFSSCQKNFGPSKNLVLDQHFCKNIGYGLIFLFPPGPIEIKSFGLGFKILVYPVFCVLSLLAIAICYSYMYCNVRPPIINFLFPVTRPHCNFRAACIFIITFDDHVIKILLFLLCIIIMLLS